MDWLVVALEFSGLGKFLECCTAVVAKVVTSGMKVF
jgi:hypothetical protein